MSDKAAFAFVETRVGPWKRTGSTFMAGDPPHGEREYGRIAVSTIWADAQHEIPLAFTDADGCVAVILGPLDAAWVESARKAVEVIPLGPGKFTTDGDTTTFIGDVWAYRAAVLAALADPWEPVDLRERAGVACCCTGIEGVPPCDVAQCPVHFRMAAKLRERAG